MKRIYAVILSSLFAICIAVPQNTEFSGVADTNWGVFIPDTEKAGNFSQGDTVFTGTLETYNGNSSLYMEGSVSFDALNMTSPAEDQNTVDVELSEAYGDYSGNIFGIRFGRQKIVWGKADGINVTNAVFPEDMSSLYIDDRTLAVDAVRVSLSGEKLTADMYWIPFFHGTLLPSNILNSVNSIEKPELSLANSEYGIKLSGYFSFCDVSLYGFYGFDKMMFIDYETGTQDGVPQISVNGQYKKVAMIGADAAFPIGETVIRVETAFYPDRHNQVSAENVIAGNDSTVQRNELSFLAGVDWMPGTWTVTAQYYGDYLVGSKDTLERTATYTHGITLNVAKTFFSETLELEVSGVIGLNDFDSALEPKITYSFTDTLKGSAGAYLFFAGPDNDGTYGVYKDLSSLYVTAKYSF